MLPVILILVFVVIAAGAAAAVRCARRHGSCTGLATKDDISRAGVPPPRSTAGSMTEARHVDVAPPETIRPLRRPWAGPMTIHETTVMDSGPLPGLLMRGSANSEEMRKDCDCSRPASSRGLPDKLFISLPAMTVEQEHWMLKRGDSSDFSGAQRIRRVPSAPPGFLEILAGEDSEFAPAAAASIPAARVDGVRSGGQGESHAALKVQSYSSTVSSSRGSLIQSRDSNFEASGNVRRPHPPPTFSQWRTGGHVCRPEAPNDDAGGEGGCGGSFQLPSLDFSRSGLPSPGPRSLRRMDTLSSARSRGAVSDSDGSRGLLGATSASIGGPRSGRSHAMTTDVDDVDDGGSISVALPGGLSARSSLPPSATASAAISRQGRTPARGSAAMEAAAAALAAAAVRSRASRSGSPHSVDASDTLSVTFPPVRAAAAVRSPDHSTVSTPARRTSISFAHSPWPRSPDDSISVNMAMPQFTVGPTASHLRAPMPRMHSAPLDGSPMHAAAAHQPMLHSPIPSIPSSPMHDSPMRNALSTLPDAALIALHESMTGSITRSGSVFSTVDVNIPLPPEEQYQLLQAQSLLRSAEEASARSDHVGSVSDDGEYV